MRARVKEQHAKLDALDLHAALPQSTDIWRKRAERWLSTSMQRTNTQRVPFALPSAHASALPLRTPTHRPDDMLDMWHMMTVETAWCSRSARRVSSSFKD